MSIIIIWIIVGILIGPPILILLDKLSPANHDDNIAISMGISLLWPIVIPLLLIGILISIFIIYYLQLLNWLLNKYDQRKRII